MYQGDIRINKTLDFKFTTVDTTGVPTTLSGSPVVSVYVANGTVQITAGITLTTNFDSVVGLNHLRIVATTTNGYGTQTDNQAVITTGTAAGSSLVGYVPGNFSIENRSAVMSTVADRTLDIDTTGNAGIDWANVSNPTNPTNLANTIIGLASEVALVSELALSALSQFADTDTGYTTGDIVAGSIVRIGTQDTWSTTARTITGGVVTTVTGSVGSVVGLNAALVDTTISSRLAPTVAGRTLDVTTTGAAGIDWGNIENPAAFNTMNNTQIGAVVTAGQVLLVTGDVQGNVDGSVGSIAPGGIAASAFAANAIDSSALAQNAGQEIADEVLNRNIAGGGSGNTRNVRNALRRLRNRVKVAALSTIYEEDDTTPAWEAVTTTAAGNPVTEVDPT